MQYVRERSEIPYPTAAVEFVPAIAHGSKPPPPRATSRCRYSDSTDWTHYFESGRRMLGRSTVGRRLLNTSDLPQSAQLLQLAIRLSLSPRASFGSTRKHFAVPIFARSRWSHSLVDVAVR